MNVANLKPRKLTDTRPRDRCRFNQIAKFNADNISLLDQLADLVFADHHIPGFFGVGQGRQADLPRLTADDAVIMVRSGIQCGL